MNPAASVRPPAPSRRVPPLLWVLIAVAGAIALALSGLVLTAVLNGVTATTPVSQQTTAPATPTRPSRTTSDEPTAAPAPSETQEPVPDNDATAENIGERLQAKNDEYRDGMADGTIWARLDDTPYNRTAITAYRYLIIDMKGAVAFGADDDTAKRYQARMDELEAKLLAGQPLGTDISIALSDKTFTYDGDTGEGGFTAP